VVRQIFAWSTALQTPVSVAGVARRLTEAQVPSPRGKPRCSPAAVRHILRAPSYIGVAYSGQTRTRPASKRWSPLHPVGRGISRRGSPSEEWLPSTVPTIVSQDRFEAAHTRLEWHKQMGAIDLITALVS
jgi:Recombinase